MLYPHFMKNWKNSNPDDFLAMFYGNIVRNCMVYIPNIPFQVAALTMKKLSDKIFHHYRKSTTPVTPTNSPTPITEDELEAVQYLPGYVVRKCSKKSPEESETFKILNEMITSDYSSQELIAAQSRGGLTAVTPAAQSMFVKAEAKFRQETTSKSLKKIDTKQMVIDLMKDMDVIISTYNRILQDISVDDEIKYALLMKMLALYLRVRSFSLARSLTTKYRLANKKGKQKALRKNLRNLSSQGDKWGGLHFILFLSKKGAGGKRGAMVLNVLKTQFICLRKNIVLKFKAIKIQFYCLLIIQFFQYSTRKNIKICWIWILKITYNSSWNFSLIPLHPLRFKTKCYV